MPVSCASAECIPVLFHLRGNQLMCLKTIPHGELKHSKDKQVEELLPIAFTPCLNKYVAVNTACDKKWVYLCLPALKCLATCSMSNLRNGICLLDMNC